MAIPPQGSIQTCQPVNIENNVCFLLKALAAFFMLLYIHIIFSRTPITCLDHIKSSWPRHGIVRIDITRSGQGNSPESQDYLLQHSYAKEQRIHQREQFEYQTMFGFWGGPQRLVLISLHHFTVSYWIIHLFLL